MTTEETYRYPGSRPFQDTSLDRQLFWGRAEESHELLHLTLAERLVVIFAKSGLGKSSLINAGLLEPLRRRDFLPMVVRVNDPDLGPLSTVYKDIEDALYREGIEVLTEPGGRLETEYGLVCQGGSRRPGELSELCFDKRVPLWLFFTETELWRGDVLCEPILVFDQFEELFSLQSPEKREELVQELANLVRQRIISLDGTEEDAELRAPALKILLSLREDWLGSLDKLVHKIPGILTHRFRLGAMKKEQAREAIEQPAAVESDDVDARAFTYTSEAVDAILDFLSRRRQQGEMVVTDKVAPSQLQLICRHLETLVAKPGHEPVITLEDLGGRKEKVPEVLNGVLEKYYDEQTTRVASGLRLRAVRRLCETGLVVNGRRASSDGAVLRHRFGVTAEELRKLTDCHLLRAVPRLDSVYYEIAHDTLVRPIMTSRAKRRQRRHRTWSTALAAALAVAATLSAWNLRARHVLEERGRILAEIHDQASQDDPLGVLLHALESSERAGCLDDSDDEACVPIAEALAGAVGAAREIGPPAAAAESGAATAPRIGRTTDSAELPSGGLRQVDAVSNQLRIFDDGQPRQDIWVPSAKLNAVAVDASGRRIATAATDGTLRLWERWHDGLRALSEPWDNGAGEILAMAFDPRQERFLTSGRDGGLRLWSPNGTALEHEAVDDEEIRGLRINTIAWSGDGRQIAIGGKDGVVRVWDGAWRRFERHGKGVRGVAFDPAGQRVASVGDDGTLRIWDLRDSAHRRFLDDDEENELKAVAWSGDGLRVATGGTSKDVHLWQLDGTRELVGRHDGAVLSVAFRADGTLASGGRDGAVRIWDPATGDQLGFVADFKRYVNSVVCAADGTLVGGSYGGTVIVVPGDLELFRARLAPPLVDQHEVSQHDLTAVALSPGGTYLASGSSDSTVRLRQWDSEEQAFKRMVSPIRGPWGEVKALAFDVGGEKLAAYTADGRFRIWNSYGDLRLSFPAGGAEIETLELTDGGDVLVSRAADGSRRYWDVTEPSEAGGLDARATACGRLATLGDGRDPATTERLHRVLRQICGAPLREGA